MLTDAPVGEKSLYFCPEISESFPERQALTLRPIPPHLDETAGTHLSPCHMIKAAANADTLAPRWLVGGLTGVKFVSSVLN